MDSSGRVKVGTTTDSGNLPNIFSVSTTTYGIESYGPIAGVKSYGATYGIIAEAFSDGQLVSGIMASATNDSAFFGTYIGGIFVASGGPVKYSLRLQDGTEAINKVLVSQDGFGSANWSSSVNLTSIIASASSTTDVVRITQTGTGNALVVEDSTNPDTSAFVITNSGNVGIGLTATSNKFEVNGNMKLSGTFSGSNNNYVSADAITQTVLLYLSNNC